MIDGSGSDFASVSVSNTSDLLAALATSSGGETIVLAAGDYGAINLDGFLFDEPITIVSETPGQAVIEELTIFGSSNLIFEGMHFESPVDGTTASSIINVNSSDLIQIRYSEINGPVDDFYHGHYGIRVTDSTNVAFEGNYIHDVNRVGVFEYSEGLVVSGNSADYIGDDNYKFVGVQDVLIENNIGAPNVFAAPDAHLDFIQFQGVDSSDIVVRGNVLFPENEGEIQGIFFDDAHYTNVLIEQNIIVTGMVRGISVSSGTNVVARDNTVLDIDGEASKATLVLVDGESYNNIQGSYPAAAGLDSNLTLQQWEPSGDFHYDNFFLNATLGFGMEITDLTPVPGSLVEQYGAYERLMELLGQTPVVPEDPVDPEPNAPPPVDEPEQPEEEPEQPPEAPRENEGDNDPAPEEVFPDVTAEDDSNGIFDWLFDFLASLFGSDGDVDVDSIPDGGRDNLQVETATAQFDLASLIADIPADDEENSGDAADEEQVEEDELMLL